ncbi:BMP family ABC transporter substrate-binding protein [Rhodobacteraceae bacterium nBUS_24]|jgi:basic membrane protein A and related proteins
MTTNKLNTINRRAFLQRSTAASLVAGSSMNLMAPTGAFAAEALAPVAEKDAVMAFGLFGPISDEGWTYSHHTGANAVRKAFPQATVLEIENTPTSADGTRVFRQFVQDGANLVVACSVYADVLYAAADRSPNVGFLETAGPRPSSNVSSFYVQHWNPAYIIGAAAGVMTKTGKIGYIGSFPIPTVYSDANALQLGAQSVNPDVQTQVININSWFDPQAANQATNALADAGCDMVFSILDDATHLAVAQKRGIMAATWNTDNRKHGPDAYVSSVMLDWDVFYVNEFRNRIEGKWTGNRTELLALGNGVDRDEWGQAVPQAARDAGDAAREKILAGWNPFSGSMKDNTGAQRLNEGDEMSVADVYGWTWAVEGVSGL